MIPVDSAPLTEIVQMAIQTRPTEPYMLNPLEPRDSEIEAGQKLLDRVQDFTSMDLLGSIASFIQDLSGHLPINLEELKKDRIYASRPDKLVVKVFPKNKGKDELYKFVREISGQKALEDLDLKRGAVVKIAGVGKCVLNGQNYFLLALHLAPGVEIKKSLESIFTSQDREQTITSCQHVLHRLGELFAEMHTRKAVTFTTTPKLADYARRGTVEKIKTCLAKYTKNGGICAEELRAVFDQKLAENQSTTLTVAAGHGDSHLMNFLHDPETDQIILIDTERAHLWVDPQGAPLQAVHIQDVARTIDDIAKIVLYHEYNPALIEVLTDSFKAGYFTKAPQIMTPIELDLGVSVAFLSRLASASLWESAESPKDQVAKKRIYDYYLYQILKSKEDHATCN